MSYLLLMDLFGIYEFVGFLTFGNMAILNLDQRSKNKQLLQYKLVRLYLLTYYFFLVSLVKAVSCFEQFL